LTLLIIDHPELDLNQTSNFLHDVWVDSFEESNNEHCPQVPESEARLQAVGKERSPLLDPVDRASGTETS
jgi:hypothetical protein